MKINLVWALALLLTASVLAQEEGVTEAGSSGSSGSSGSGCSLTDCTTCVNSAVQCAYCEGGYVQNSDKSKCLGEIVDFIYIYMAIAEHLLQYFLGTKENCSVFLRGKKIFSKKATTCTKCPCWYCAYLYKMYIVSEIICECRSHFYSCIRGMLFICPLQNVIQTGRIWFSTPYHIPNEVI